MVSTTSIKSKTETKIKKERKPRTIKPKVEGEKTTTKRKARPLAELEKTIDNKIENPTESPNITKPTKVQKLILSLRRYFGYGI